MSQSTMSQSQIAQAKREMEEIRQEMSFQHVLLASLDNNKPDRGKAEKQIRNEIRSLDRKLRDLRRRTAIAASKLKSSNPVKQGFQATPSRSLSSNHAISKFDSSNNQGVAAGSNINSHHGRDYSHPLTSQSSAASTQHFSTNSLPSSPQMNLPNRKRSYSKHLDGRLGFVEDNKSRRTSQSPFETAPSTPSTISSGEDRFGAFDESEFVRLQEEAAERLKQEKLDEEFARSLHEAGGSEPMMDTTRNSMQPPARSGPSAYNRMSGAHQLSQPRRAYGVSMKPEQHSSGLKQEAPGSSMFSFNPYEYPSRSNGVENGNSSLHMPGSFQDDSSNAGDSDIEIISSAFRDNGRHSSSRPAGAMANPLTVHQQPTFEQRGSGSNVSGLPFVRGAANTAALARGVYGNPSQSNLKNNQDRMGGNHVHGNGQPGSKNGMPSASSTHDIPVYRGYGAVPNADPSLLPNVNPIGDILARNNMSELSEYLDLGPGMQDQLDNLVNDPRKTAKEIEDLLENIRPDVELAPEDREGTPEGLAYALYEHQKIALSWMKSMEQGNNKGGILADDMGLGKTISTISLILTRPSPNPARKTTLIVGPVSLIRQWDKELRSKIKPEHRLSTRIVHGSARKLGWDELRVYDVVLTTYGTLAAEFKRFQTADDRNKLNGGGEMDPVLMKKKFPLVGPKSMFYRVILDEAQNIKNKSTGWARACCTLSAQYRFCLTGTPMMNSVQELYSLINFLKIKPYNEWTRFQENFGVLTKVDEKLKRSAVEMNTERAMTKLQALLKAILLRRTKKSQIDGKPIITLPEKTEEIQHVVFDEHEQEFYTALETKTQLVFNKYMKAGTVGKNYSNVLVLLLRLRQACCHPHLIQDFEQPPAIASDVPLEVMLDLARDLAPEVVARILETNGNFECPVCYDASLNPIIITPCGHDTCSECLARLSDQAVRHNGANAIEAARDSRCPFCRGAFNPSKVIDYTTFKKIHKPEAEGPHDVETENASDTDGDSSEDESDSGSEANEKGNLKHFIVGDDTTEDEGTDDEEESLDEAVSARKAKSKRKGAEKTKRSKKSKGKKIEKPKHMSIAMLKKEASKTASGRRKYMKYLRKHWQPSAKVTKCVELLEKFRAENQKTIIFSQFVSLLDLLQVPIDDKGWECLRYDGGMSAGARNNAIHEFTDSPTCKIMLISLKAGNSGINLVAASRVILLDPFWNPYIEMQAVDRAHRIGQQRVVQVHRILIQDTVEDRIIELQQRKQAMVESALDEKAGKGISHLDTRELAFLFGVGAR
ncbi:SWI/SNF family DNA-dependent ATPase Ris1 [Diplocarpon rosae]|nr:SWI/SNF family DNA-dependent ATPase Ris1 [Diplocarpon rosae]